MYKKFVLLLSFLLIFSSTTAFAAKNSDNDEQKILFDITDIVEELYAKTEKIDNISEERIAFKNFLNGLFAIERKYLEEFIENNFDDITRANFEKRKAALSMDSIIEKYEKGDNIGCLEDIGFYLIFGGEVDYSYVFYYLSMVYTNIGAKEDAIKGYKSVIYLSENPKLTEYAQKGLEFLEQTDKAGKTSAKSEEQNNDKEAEQLEKFINAPYGSGLSPEIEKQMKEGKLMRIQESINKKDSLENNDIQRIKKFDDENSSKTDAPDKIAQAEPSDKEILHAIKTLRDAGINVSVQASQIDEACDTVSNIQTSKAASDDTLQNVPAQQSYDFPVTMINGYTDPQMAQISMMLGNNNNNSSGMMNMLPFLIQQNQSGQNIDPQLMQAVMLQQMMPSMDFGLSNNDN